MDPSKRGEGGGRRERVAGRRVEAASRRERVGVGQEGRAP